MVDRVRFELTKPFGNKFTVYLLYPLVYLSIALHDTFLSVSCNKSEWQDLNSQPPDPKSGTLPN